MYWLYLSIFKYVENSINGIHMSMCPCVFLLPAIIFKIFKDVTTIYFAVTTIKFAVQIR